MRNVKMLYRMRLLLSEYKSEYEKSEYEKVSMKRKAETDYGSYQIESIAAGIICGLCGCTEKQ